MDWAKLLGSALDMFKAFAPMAGDQIPFDVTKLPPGSIFAEFFKPTFHYSKPVASGLYRRNEGSFGPETWFGVAGAAAVIGGAAPQGGPMEGSIPTEPLTPPEPPGGDGQ